VKEIYLPSVAEATSLEADEEDDQTEDAEEEIEVIPTAEGTSSATESEENGDSGEEGEVEVDDDVSFLNRIVPTRVADICENREYMSWTVIQKKALRDLFKDDLKPGVIIDGQHRLKGTCAAAEIPFSVTMLPFADWAELAFQFIVNNSSAKRVDDNLLIAIVGESLRPEELARTEARLSKAGIKVSLIKAAMRVQTELNPFQGMLKTNTPGETGFLDGTAVQKKIVQVWYGGRDRSGLKASFKAFRAHSTEKRRWSMQGHDKPG
jgi:hypothetical protein